MAFMVQAKKKIFFWPKFDFDNTCAIREDIRRKKNPCVKMICFESRFWNLKSEVEVVSSLDLVSKTP